MSGRLRRAWQRIVDLVVTAAVYLGLAGWPEDPPADREEDR